MSFGGEDKIVSVRFNPMEKKELDYVVAHSSYYYRLPVATVIKNLISAAYHDMKSKEEKK